MAKIYLDACAIIETREKLAPAATELTNLIVQCAGTHHEIITSELSLMEVLIHPIRGLLDRSPQEEDPQAREYHEWYRGNLVADGMLLRTIPISRDVLIQAAIIRARRTQVRTPDALHVATAMAEKAAFFVTNDGGIGRAFGDDDAWRDRSRPAFTPMTAEAVLALRESLPS